jgi:phage terminase large subunit-like protein
MLIHIDSRKFKIKPTGAEIGGIKGRFKNAASVKDMTVKQIADALTAGQTIEPGVCPFSEESAKKGKKGTCKEDFARQTIFFNDIDNENENAPKETPEHIAQILAENNLKVVFMYESFHSRPDDLRFRYAVVCSEEITDNSERERIQGALIAMSPQSDVGCINADRIFFGTDKRLIDGYTDFEAVCQKSDLLAFAEKYKLPEEKPVKQPIGKQPERKWPKYGEPIPTGQRHGTLVSFAAEILKKCGATEKAHEIFMKRVAQCEEPKPDDEIEKIWRAACNFYQNNVANQPGYIQPDEYAAMEFAQSVEPYDFTDVGQARVFVGQYGDRLLYSTATKYAQARLLFDEAHNMIKQSPVLSKHFRKRKNDLYYEPTMSKFQPLARNSDTLDGLNASFVIMDELHGVRDRNLYEVMKQSMSARRSPLLVMITTAGTVRECIFDEMYEYAAQVADGNVIDEHFLPILYELDSRAEWTDPAAWVKANPALNTIKKFDDLSAQVERAKHNRNELPGVLCKEFNVRETVKTAWLSFDDINNESVFSLDDFRGAYCIGGVDLSITTDLTAASLLFMKPGDSKKYVTEMFWLPADRLQERVKQDKIPYDRWFERGLVRLCTGNTINYSDVTAWFKELVQEYSLFPAWVYYDSYSARYFVEEMQMEGFNMVRCIQGAKTLSLPMQMLGADLQAHRVIYNNNPVLKWCLTNTGVQTDRNGNIVPIKNQSPKQRIDGTAALLDSYVGLYEHLGEFTSAIE